MTLEQILTVLIGLGPSLPTDIADIEAAFKEIASNDDLATKAKVVLTDLDQIIQAGLKVL